MKRQVILGIFSCLLCGACVSSHPQFEICDSPGKLCANSYMASPRYNPEKLFVFFLSMTTLGDRVDISVAWIGNDDIYDMEIMGKKVEFEQTVKLEIPEISWQKYGWVNLNDDEIRKITEGFTKQLTLSVRINDKSILLSPYQMCIYDKPFPYLQAYFYPGVPFYFIYEKQLPEHMLKNVEKQRELNAEKFGTLPATRKNDSILEN